MEIGEEKQGAVTILRPVGQIDNKTCLVFEDRLRRGLDAGPTLVDFAGVEFISSAGLAVLMTAIKRAKAEKGRLAVAALRPMVQEIFAIARFNLVVKVYGTAAEGVAELQ
jgi:anti-anti-sigma factor